MLVVAGYLVAENRALQRDVDVAAAERAMLMDRARELQKQLDEQRSADAEATGELSRLRASLAAIEQRAAGGAAARPAPTVIASFVLPAGVRGANDVATITLPPGTDVVRLHVPLEEERFATFSAVLRDATSSQIVWHDQGLRATAERNHRAVAIALPATLLPPKTYLLELTGMGAGGVSEPLSPYVFQVVIP
jgi:hypothetical protein